MGIYEKKYTHVCWTLLEYVTQIGERRVITEWRNKELKSVQRKADFDNFLSDMARKKSWGPPELKALKRKQKEFVELRWKSENIQHRIGGYFAAPNEFVMLIGFTHKQTTYDPSGAMEALTDRNRNLKEGRATLREFEILSGQ
jgi:hypothetical protein